MILFLGGQDPQQMYLYVITVDNVYCYPVY